MLFLRAGKLTLAATLNSHCLGIPTLLIEPVT